MARVLLDWRDSLKLDKFHKVTELELICLTSYRNGLWKGGRGTGGRYCSHIPASDKSQSKLKSLMLENKAKLGNWIVSSMFLLGSQIKKPCVNFKPK